MNRAGLTARKSLQNHLEVLQIAHWQALNLSLVAKFVCQPRYSPFAGTRATTGERTAIVKRFAWVRSAQVQAQANVCSGP
jgi:hypothetical protein